MVHIWSVAWTDILDIQSWTPWGELTTFLATTAIKVSTSFFELQLIKEIIEGDIKIQFAVWTSDFNLICWAWENQGIS